MEKIKQIWKCPAHFGEYGRDIWYRIGAVLTRDRVLTTLDKQSFIMLCTSYEMALLAFQEIKQHGQLIPGRDGPKVNPAIASYKAYSELYSKMASRFGLSPLDRKKIDIRPPEKPLKGENCLT